VQLVSLSALYPAGHANLLDNFCPS